MLCKPSFFMYYARHTKQGGIAAAVAQLVEPWIVIPVVVGSSPISRPIFSSVSSGSKTLLKISKFHLF